MKVETQQKRKGLYEKEALVAEITTTPNSFYCKRTDAWNTGDS